MEKLFDKIFPPKCMFCNSYGRSFCYACLHTCSILPYGFCLVCDKPALSGCTHILCSSNSVPINVFSPFVYKDKVRDCIHKSKYGSMEFAALKLLAQEGCVFASKVNKVYENTVVVPIPLSKKRYKERGFNQSLVIAREVSTYFKLNLSTNLLFRAVDTQVQSALSRIERQKNVSGAFIAPKPLNNAHILLIDDITTTGATFLEAAKALYNSGASKVSCFALSKKL